MGRNSSNTNNNNANDNVTDKDNDNDKNTNMRQFFVSYNNSFRILRGLPMICNASDMFACSNADSCQAIIWRSIIYIVCVVDWMSPLT